MKVVYFWGAVEFVVGRMTLAAWTHANRQP